MKRKFDTIETYKHGSRLMIARGRRSRVVIFRPIAGANIRLGIVRNAQARHYARELAASTAAGLRRYIARG